MISVEVTTDIGLVYLSKPMEDNTDDDLSVRHAIQEMMHDDHVHVSVETEDGWVVIPLRRVVAIRLREAS